MSRESNTKAHIGKTARDRASGALARRDSNQQARAIWQKNKKSEKFPYSICNGFRGRQYKRWIGMN
jgi:hypothetical protein